MTAIADSRTREGPLALLYSMTAGLGFVTDAAVLSLLLHLHMEPAWARVISLTCAMQATFWVNGLFVFRCLTRQGWGPAWLGYMVTNGFGNFCNYWTFVTLVSLHHPILSNHWFGLVAGGLVAWTINYSCARYLIFGLRREDAARSCTPSEEVLRGLAGRISTLKGTLAHFKH